MTTRVLIADDHNLVRTGLAMLVREIPGFEVIGEASTGREAVDFSRRQQPDVVILDLSMPELHGIEAMPQIRRHAPQARVLVLSMHATEQHVTTAFRGGANGYLLKEAAAEELTTALKTIVAGGLYISPKIAHHVAQALVSPQRQAEGAAADLGKLSPRQREILQSIAEGRSTRDIAERLSLSVKTVETHRTELMSRLGIHDVAGLTRFAIRTGLVSVDL